MEKKKAPKSHKIQKVYEIDRIPKWWKQPRSALGHRRRRTDFSLSFCSFPSSSALSNSPLGKGLLLESSRGKDKPGCDTITNLEEMRTRRENILQFPAVQCSNFEDLRKTLFSNFTEVPVIEVESVSENALFDAWSGRNADKQKSDTLGKQFTPDKSQINESSNFCITPGSTVWDKTGRQLWPAEVGDGMRSSWTEDTWKVLNGWSSEGRRPMKAEAKPMNAFVDPAGNLSQSDVDQNTGLQLNLLALECQSFSKEFTESSDDPNCSITRDQSPDKWNSSSSSRTESDCMERRRGTRERKPKVHFDEVNFSLKSMRKDRRFRIMRFLGLAAPVASPFQ
ncbi:hypothetical protein RHSIM_RhsimUnG0068000 [Rhododendron simsii]|uniref:Uncharacterized protein n=1 Tax=Rhododendron simsii TaxID=118357 RepID=A0A834FWX7_RHOSS|nr:hypothetical protein RHSIM_RhsimUnG0068000 [Rhododendron simsii]